MRSHCGFSNFCQFVLCKTKPFSVSCDSDMKAFALAERLLAFLDSLLVGKRSLEKSLSDALQRLGRSSYCGTVGRGPES